MEIWIAEDLVLQYGDSLIGKLVLTQEIGDYSGGLTTIIDIYPDLNAPEVVCKVHRYYNNEKTVVGIF